MPKPRLTSVSQLPAPSLAHEEVEFGDFTVLVWELTGREIQKWSKDNITVKGGKVVRLNNATATARLLAAALKDDHGRPMFSLADINQLMEQGAADLARVEKVARVLSGLLDDDEGLTDDEEPADDENEDGEPEGNDSTPRTLSSIDSPSPSGAERAMNS